MNERKIKMLEIALALFAKKGYHATSIQEITEAWGISKGAFYNNFSSKEELMLSIMKHYTVLAFKQMQNVTKGGSEKEDLVEQIRIQFSIIESHKEYIRVHMTEQPMQMPEEIRRFAYETRVKTFQWYLKRLLQVFGPKIEPYALDCVVLLQGMIQGYMSLIIIDQKPLLIEKIARFLVNRLESIVNQLGVDAPLLTKDMMENYFFVSDESELEGVQHRIVQLRNELHGHFPEVLDTLEAEFAGGSPREYMVEGLLLYLEKRGLDGGKSTLKELQDHVKNYFGGQL